MADRSSDLRVRTGWPPTGAVMLEISDLVTDWGRAGPWGILRFRLDRDVDRHAPFYRGHRDDQFGIGSGAWHHGLRASWSTCVGPGPSQGAPDGASSDEVPARPDEVPARPDEVPARPDEVPARPDEVPARPDEVLPPGAFEGLPGPSGSDQVLAPVLSPMNAGLQGQSDSAIVTPASLEARRRTPNLGASPFFSPSRQTDEGHPKDPQWTSGPEFVRAHSS
jgi:hypothetical protein